MKLRRLLAVLVALGVVATGQLVAQSVEVRRTFYFHSLTPAANVEQAAAYPTNVGGPFMDETPPLTPAPKTVIVPPLGNDALRKNPLTAWFGSAPFVGTISAPEVTFWASSASAVAIDVALFENGPATTSGLIGTKSLVVEPGVSRYVANFLGTSAVIDQGLLVQFTARLADDTTTELEIIYDSTEFASNLSFAYSPEVSNLPVLDDPFGIAVGGFGTIYAANAGTGEIVTVAGGKVASVVAGGLPAGGFARGATGLAFDFAGNLYAGNADAGSVEVIDADGFRSTYARDLGTPIGIAFDASGNLLVADRDGKRLVRVAPSGTQTVLATFAEGPFGVAVAPSGRVVVTTQADGKVHDVSAATQIADLPTGSTAEGVAFGGDGKIYVGDGLKGRVISIDGAGTIADAKTGVGGPIMLAPGVTGDTLLYASQGEGGADAVGTVASGASTPDVHRPSGLPAGGAAPTAWVHRGGVVAPGAKVAGPARTVTASEWSGTLPSSAARYTGESGVEPTLGFQDDGDIYMVESRNPCSIALGSLVCGRTEVYRSRDNAMTWLERTPDIDQGVEMSPVSADPYMYVDTTQRVFSIDLTAACLYISYSDDDAESWTQVPLGCQNPPADHQTFVASKPRGVTTKGYPNQLTICSNAVAATLCQRSLDGGDTWEYTGNAYVAQVSAHPLFCNGVITSHLAADPDGRLFLPRVSTTRACVSVSEDGGKTWTVRTVGAPVAGISGDHESRIASDSEGNLYYLFVGSDRRPYLTVSTDHALTWSSPKMIAPAGVTRANLPAIAAGAPGKIVMSYMGSTIDYGYNAASPNLAKATWNAYVTTSVDALSADPLFATTTANALTDPVKRQACGPGRCDLVFDFLDVKIGPDGRAYAAFGDMCVGSCLTDRTYGTSFVTAWGFLAPLITGPNLREGGDLSTLQGGGNAVPGETPSVIKLPSFGIGETQLLVPWLLPQADDL